MPTRRRRGKEAGGKNGSTAAPAQAPEAPVLAVGTRLLDCALTVPERAEAGQKLGLLIEQRTDCVADAASAATARKDEIKQLDKQIETAAAQVARGIETRLVQTVTVANYEAGTADTLRGDTREIIASRPLSDVERQQGFNFRDPAPEPEPEAPAPAPPADA
jgi:hypothetical protein